MNIRNPGKDPLTPVTPTAENDRDDERLAIRDAWAELPITAENDAAENDAAENDAAENDAAENDAAAWRSRAELLRNKLDAAEAEAERLRSALRDVITVAYEARPWGVIPPTSRR